MTTEQYLARYDVSMAQAQSVIYDYILSGDVYTLYNICITVGITNDMLADIVNYNTYGYQVTSSDVQNYFYAYGHNSDALGDYDDDFIWNPYYSSFYKIEDAGDTFYSAESIYMGTYYDYWYNQHAEALVHGYTGSADAYSFSAAMSGLMSIQLSGLVDDLDIKLYDAYNNQIGSSTNGGTSDENISYNCYAGEQVTVIVEAYGDYDYSDYMLYVEIA